MSDGAKRVSDNPDVLLVGSTPRDARVVSCGLGRENVTVDVTPDVRTAIDRLTEASEGEDGATLPSLVVIDLSGAPGDGLTVLHAIKSSPRLRTLPVIAVTGRETKREGSDDVPRRGYECGVNGHIPRPDDVEAYAAAVQRMAALWFEHASLPPASLYTEKPT